MTNNLAKIIRILSLPPFVVSAAMIIIYQYNVFNSVIEGLLVILFLGIIPVIAYPLSYAIPKIKAKGRTGQRNLAFILSLIGYSTGLIYSFVNKLDVSLMFIYLTYFVSLIILTFVNKALKVKASGHMTSMTGALILLTFLTSWYSLIPSSIFYMLVWWSSYRLKQHTSREMIFGTLIVVFAFIMTYLTFMH